MPFGISQVKRILQSTTVGLISALLFCGLRDCEAAGPGRINATAKPKLSPCVQQANSLVAKGNLKGAMSLYQQAIKQAPTDWVAYHLYGRTLALSGNKKAAIEPYRSALKLAPNNVEVLNDLGVALAATHEFYEAADILRQALSRDPMFIQAYNNYGITLMCLRDYKGAVRAFRDSLRLQPNNPAVTKRLQEALTKDIEAAAATEASGEPGCVEPVLEPKPQTSDNVSQPSESKPAIDGSNPTDSQSPIPQTSPAEPSKPGVSPQSEPAVKPAIESEASSK